MKLVDYDGKLLIIRIKSSYQEEWKELLSTVKELSGRTFIKARSVWTALPTKENIEHLRIFGFEFSDNCCQLFGEQKEFEVPYNTINVDVEKLNGLLPYQIDGVKFVEWRNGRALIADQCGLGKTIQALGYLKIHPELRPALVICPAVMKIKWMREAKKWLNERVDIFMGMTPCELQDQNISIFNYDILAEGDAEIRKEEEQRKKEAKEVGLPYRKKTIPIHGWYEEIIKTDYKIMIIDECQNLSSQSAIRTRAYKELKDNIDKIILLSGTPMKNRPEEFFTALNTVEPEIFSNHYAYLHRYCDLKYNGFGWVPSGKLSNGDELRRLVKPLLIAREKKDVLKDLPEKRDIIIPLYCEEEFRSDYEKQTEAFTEWMNAIEKRSDNEIKNEVEHLKQLAYLMKRKQMIKWIEEFLETTGEKLVVFANHRKAIEDLNEVFKKYNPVLLYGGVGDKKRQEAVDSFQNDEKVKLFIGQIQAAGVGIDLFAASNSAFVEFVWSPVDHEQAGSRLHRIGQKNAVNNYYFVAVNTIEERIVELLQTKMRNINFLVKGEEEEFIDASILKEITKDFKKEK